MTEPTTPGAKTRATRRRERITLPLAALSLPQQRALLALARYRYLTVGQMVDAGIAKAPSHIRSDVLAPLCKRQVDNLVQAHEFPRFSTTGRIPRVYSLTKLGAEVVAEIERRDVSEILYPVGGVQFSKDFEHRSAYIDACIAFDAWIAADDRRECMEMRHEFDKTGSNRGSGAHRMRSVCRVDLPSHHYIIPDGLLFFDTGTKQRAVALEIHNFPDTKRVTRQLLGHHEALETDAYPKAFGIETAGRVLSISSSAALAKRVMDRLMETPGFRESRSFQLIAFNCLENVKQDFGNGWVLADKSPARIFE